MSRARHITETERTAIALLSQQGMKPGQIAHVTGRERTSVWRVLRAQEEASQPLLPFGDGAHNDD